MSYIVAENGDLVTIDFSLKYPNGTIFFTTADKEPAKIELGSKTLLPAIESAVIGMKIQEKKTITLLKPFGPRIKELRLELNKQDIPDHIDCIAGNKITIELPGKKRVEGVLSDITEETVILDTNLAHSGQDFILTIELVMIVNK